MCHAQVNVELQAWLWWIHVHFLQIVWLRMNMGCWEGLLLHSLTRGEGTLEMGPVTISTCLNSKYLYFWIELESKAVESSVGQLVFQGLLVLIFFFFHAHSGFPSPVVHFLALCPTWFAICFCTDPCLSASFLPVHAYAALQAVSPGILTLLAPYDEWTILTDIWCYPGQTFFPLCFFLPLFLSLILPHPPPPSASSLLDLQRDWEQAELISTLVLHSAASVSFSAALGSAQSCSLCLFALSFLESSSSASCWGSSAGI